ncbi:MAG: hypothetical protein JNK05_01675 [Myxococcales bacterium]|nr:hypothetical protein [Myxococcales bacterium]
MAGLLSLAGAGCGAKTGLDRQRVFAVDPTPISLLVVGNHDNGADTAPVAPYRNGRALCDEQARHPTPVELIAE